MSDMDVDKKKEPTLCEGCRTPVKGQEDGDICTDCCHVFCYECLPTESHGCDEAK